MLPTKSVLTFAVRFLVIVVLPIGFSFCFTFKVTSVFVLAAPEKKYSTLYIPSVVITSLFCVPSVTPLEGPLLPSGTSCAIFASSDIGVTAVSYLRP